MAGSLALRKGVLYVGSEERTARVRSFDLDGRELEAGFTFCGAQDGPAAVSGLAVDEDHRVWVADGVGRQLRGFTLLGEQVAVVGACEAGKRDKRGVLGTPLAVLSRGADGEQELVVASGGRRRHALQVLPLGGGAARSLRSCGHVDQFFRGLQGVHARGPWLWACERAAGRVQVFRAEDFHLAFQLPAAAAGPFCPNAIAALEDGRLLLAQGGSASALVLLDAKGRVLRLLSSAGQAEGQVHEPADLVIDGGPDDRQTRVLVIDCEGTRVQVFNLLGDCHGTFPGFARSESSWEPTRRAP